MRPCDCVQTMEAGCKELEVYTGLHCTVHVYRLQQRTYNIGFGNVKLRNIFSGSVISCFIILNRITFICTKCKVSQIIFHMNHSAHNLQYPSFSLQHFDKVLFEFLIKMWLDTGWYWSTVVLAHWTSADNSNKCWVFYSLVPGLISAYVVFSFSTATLLPEINAIRINQPREKLRRCVSCDLPSDMADLSRSAYTIESSFLSSVSIPFSFPSLSCS